jgi:hypothetical protein
MDFKSILNKLDGMEAPVATPAAPVLEKAVQLNEDAELRVLAGTSSYLSEAKKAKEEKKEEEKVDEVFDADAKVGDTKKTATGGTATKTATGLVHKGKKYGGEEEKSDDDEDAPKAKKAKKESIDTEAFKGKFAKMVEAKKAEKKKPMKEAAKPDFLDIDGDGDKKEPMKKAAADKKAASGDDEKDSKGLSAKQKKLPLGLQKAIAKKTVKESIEPKLTFKDMVKLVQESGGQQAIDPVDTALFTWAQRVAANKFTESTKAELYAGLIYERNGGVFEMYDVLSEDKK